MPEEVQSTDQQTIPKEIPVQTVHKINFFRIVIGVIAGVILLGMGFGVYLLIQSTSKTTNEATQVTFPNVKKATPSATATPSANKDETAGWKVYTNNQYKFSIKYPEDKFCSNKLLEEGQTTKALIKESVFEVLFKPFDCESDWSFAVSIAPKDHQVPGNKFGDFDLLSESNVTIDGIASMKKIYGADPGTFFLVAVKKGDYTYVLQFNNLIFQQKAGDELSTGQADSMISTFKFLPSQ